MLVDESQVEKIAHLARIAINETDITTYAQDLSNILQFAETINQADTDQVSPMTHPFAISQRLREDIVTEVDQHQLLQQSAPMVESDLYLVEKVIE